MNKIVSSEMSNLKEDLRDQGMNVFENIPKHKKILFISVCSDGVFLLREKGEEWKKALDDISYEFNVGKYLYPFLFDDENIYYANGNNLITLDDLIEPFENLVSAIMSGHPVISENDYIKRNSVSLSDVLTCKVDGFDEIEHDPFIPKQKLDVILEGLSQKKSAFGRTEKTIDGKSYVKINSDEWALISDEFDPDEHSRTAAFFGIFGVHRFKEHRIFSGICYLLTFGCFGILSLTDCLSMLTGTYRLKDGTYLATIKNKKKAAVQMLVTVLSGVIIFFSANFLLKASINTASNFVTNQISQETEGMSEEELIEYYMDLLGYTEEEVLEMLGE